MIFQHTWQQVLSGEKTQTRRLVESEDEEVRPVENNPTWPNIFCVLRFSWEYPARARKIYEVGKTYSVQPGRGQKSVGRIKLLAIRWERIQEITPADAKAEGITGIPRLVVGFYASLWDRIHLVKGEQWQDNPEVWVLTFEVCKDGER